MNPDHTRCSLRRAAIVVGVLVVLTLFGGRDATVVLSGTAPASPRALLGACYAVAWLSTVVLAPVAVIAAVLERLLVYAFTARG